MKGKSYINKYLSDFENRCFDDVPFKDVKAKSHVLGMNFLTDFHELCKARNIGKGSTELALVNIIKEFNQKWKNVSFGINTFFEKTFEISVLKNEGFIELFKASENNLSYIIEKYNID